MSRRHHGRPHHPAHGAADGGRRVTGVSPSPAGTGQERPHVVQPPATGTPTDIAASANGASSDGVPTDGAPVNVVSHADGAPLPNGAPLPDRRPRPSGAPPPMGARAPLAHAVAPPRQTGHASGPGPAPGDAPANPDRNGQCTAPQLRRFIKSRPYVPMHELRRRFGIDGGDDDVTPVRLDPGWVYVGLPTREGSLLGDLLRAGEIGYELSLDPRTPIVIGVYPMRPIPRS
jgi:hypothetical protein